MTFEYWWAAYIARGPIRNVDVVKRVAEAAWDYATEQVRHSEHKCPQCGREATFKDASGVLWCDNAHYFKPAKSEELKTNVQP